MLRREGPGNRRSISKRTFLEIHKYIWQREKGLLRARSCRREYRCGFQFSGQANDRGCEGRRNFCHGRHPDSPSWEQRGKSESISNLSPQQLERSIATRVSYFPRNRTSIIKPSIRINDQFSSIQLGRVSG